MVILCQDKCLKLAKKKKDGEKKMNIPKTAKLIKDSNDHWVDIDGSIYYIDRRNGKNNNIIKKTQTIVRGYKYCGINYVGKGTVSKRVHRLVAEAFLSNPNEYKVVGHKNNIKSDNRVENLYWTTTSKNTQKAFDDGLANNDKGFDDSQSKPVYMFETKTNALVGVYGSISIASESTGISKTTISRQAKYKRPVRREFYFRFIDDIDSAKTDTNHPSLVGMYDYDTDALIETFINGADASNKTGIPKRTIHQHIKNDRKPLRKYLQVYFLSIK